MSDNVSRQAAIDAVNYNCTSLKDIKRAIMKLPSTDRNGEWLEAPCEDEYDKFVLCSECRTFGGSGALAEVVKNCNFCPNCGADMRGGGLSDKRTSN